MMRGYNPRVRHRHRKRRPPGGSAQENTHTRLWRDYIEGLLTWSDRLRMAKLYGTGSPEFKRIQAWNRKHPYKKGMPGKHLIRSRNVVLSRTDNRLSHPRLPTQKGRAK